MLILPREISNNAIANETKILERCNDGASDLWQLSTTAEIEQ